MAHSRYLMIRLLIDSHDKVFSTHNNGRLTCHKSPQTDGFSDRAVSIAETSSWQSVRNVSATCTVYSTRRAPKPSVK